MSALVRYRGEAQVEIWLHAGVPHLDAIRALVLAAGRGRHESGVAPRFSLGDTAAVSLWLGHTDLTTTARYLNADVGQLHALNDRLVPAAVRATA